MKNVLFLFALVFSFTSLQAQRIGSNIPETLKGEQVLLVTSDMGHGKTMSNMVGADFAGARFIPVLTPQYYNTVKKGEGYVMLPVKEVTDGKMNVWLTLYKASPKAVVKQSDKQGLFPKDPALTEILAFKVDPEKLGTNYEVLYIKTMEMMFKSLAGLTDKERAAKLADLSKVDQASAFILNTSEMQPTYNVPSKVSKIHPAAIIESSVQINARIAKPESAQTAIVEIIEFFDADNNSKFEFRVFDMKSGLIYLDVVETESGNAMIDRALIERLLTDTHQLKAAGK